MTAAAVADWIHVRGALVQRGPYWWIEFTANGKRDPERDVGPFMTEKAAAAAANDFQATLVSLGALDMRARAKA